MNSETLDVNEKLDAIRNLSSKVKENFISLGEILSSVKRAKIYRFKGYDKFKEFVETEYGLSGSLASQIISVYDLYISEMGLDEEDVKEIGFEKLRIIRSKIKNSNYDERTNLINFARDTTTEDIRTTLKQEKEKEKNENIDVRGVAIDQVMEIMMEVLNCSKKDLLPRLCIYFYGIVEPSKRKEYADNIKNTYRANDRALSTVKE